MTEKTDSKTIVAIVGLTPLLTFAISELLNRDSEKFITKVSFSSDKIISDADFHIITFDVFLRHLQFFMPRKQRILIVSNENVSAGEKKHDSDILRVNLADPIDKISSKIIGAIPPKINTLQPCGDLTSREREVLILLAAGKTIKEIASSLGISVNTVLTHRKNISFKLGIRSVSGLSLYAMINGMI